MNYFISRRYAIALVVITFMVSGLFWYEASFVFDTSTPDIDSQPAAYTIGDAMRLLPSEISLYQVQRNGFNQSRILYSVTVFFPMQESKFFKDNSIDENLAKNKIVGTWVVNLKEKSSKRLEDDPVHGSHYFLQWVDDTDIELYNDGESIAVTFNALSGDIVSRRVNMLSLHFKSLKNIIKNDIEVSFKPIDTSLRECFVVGVQEDSSIKYPFACIKKTNVELTIKGYSKKIILEYIDDEAIKINDKTFNGLLSRDYPVLDVNF